MKCLDCPLYDDSFCLITGDFIDYDGGCRRAKKFILSQNKGELRQKMDKYYTEGKKEMDWFTLKDRIALITEYGFYCEDATKEKCEDCLAKDYCNYYKDYIAEEGVSDD